MNPLIYIFVVLPVGILLLCWLPYQSSMFIKLRNKSSNDRIKIINEFNEAKLIKSLTAGLVFFFLTFISYFLPNNTDSFTSQFFGSASFFYFIFLSTYFFRDRIYLYYARKEIVINYYVVQYLIK